MNNVSALAGAEHANHQGATGPAQPERVRRIGGHALVLILYGLLVAGISALSTLTGRELPAKMSTRDLVLAAVAVHKLSRTLTKDAVLSPLRAPFADHEGAGGPGEVMESPKNSGGFRGSVGELLTCPFCFDVWAITFMTAGRTFTPRLTRVCVDALAALAGADFLHLVYAKAQQIAD